ncbi:hypothetical protein G6F32_012910 [Rhizopus arrhizus]|nr:hypothetical protein G6F32_012910 [Rhizopus arrhizus]
MQAGLRLVQHQQRRRPWRVQGGGQQQDAQGAIGPFRHRQRPQQAGLVEAQGQPTIQLLEAHRGTREGILNATRQPDRISDLEDGDPGRGQIAAVVMQHRRPRGHRRLSRRRIGIAAEVVIEAPAADVLTQGDGFRHALRITDLGEQAVEQRQAVIDPIPAARMANGPAQIASALICGSSANAERLGGG